LLAVLGLGFFAALVIHPSQTLYSDYSDLVTLHLPSRQFLVGSWQQTGQVPLWCPYNFAGMPFVHDIQVSAFYPLHLPLFVLPEAWLGAAMSWLVVLHVIVAGWTIYAYARHQGLESVGALVAAIGYMFAGKWLLHLLAGGHYNMVPLAWLPLVVLWLEQAIARGSWWRATWAGAAFSLLILAAYPYVTLYAGLFVALWTVGTAWPGHLARWLGFGLWTVLIAAALGAVQLWPGLEASASASRAAGVGFSFEFVLDGLRSIVGLVGPPLTDEPNAWENRAGFGIVWLTLAALAPLRGGRRVRFEASICLGLFLFALGGAALVQWLPGFRLFRLPSRMFLIAAFPVALLAGRTTQALFSGPGLPLAARLQFRKLLLKVTAAVLMLAGVFALALGARSDLHLQWHPYWATLLVTVPGICWLLVGAPGRREATAWVALLLVDAVALTWPLVEVRPEEELYTPSASVQYLAERAGEHGRVLDFNPEDAAANDTPLWPGLPAMVGVEPVRGFNPIDIVRYKEYLQFVTDVDRPLTALDQMWTGPILGTFPIKNQNLADLLGIRYLLQPSALPLAATVQDTAGQGSWYPVLEDAEPVAFNFISVQPGGRDCGTHRLPPYTLYENRQVLPRVWVVADAAPLSARAEVLPALKRTDFRQRVLLEDYHAADAPAAETGTPRAFRPPAEAIIRSYRPNEIDIAVAGDGPGFLVLADIWFPGWTCQVDGRSTPIYRANYLFRAVELPAGARDVVFTFAPKSYVWGKMVSGGSAVGILGASLFGLVLGRGGRATRIEAKQEMHATMC
jgi:hypothetical protein